MKKLVVLTGAGISAESGLQTFRDKGGLWDKYNPYELASPEGWKKDYKKVLEFYNIRRKAVREARPNKAHYTLAELEKYFDVVIITQNVDNLHERAGSTHVVHLHGEIMKARSTGDPSLVYDLGDKDIHPGDTCEKGYQLRPHVVWFGEAVPMMEEAVRIVSQADIFLVVGTGLAVYPAASLVYYLKNNVDFYLVDKHIPEVVTGMPVKAYEMPATEGVPKVAEVLIEKYAKL